MLYVRKGLVIKMTSIGKILLWGLIAIVILVFLAVTVVTAATITAKIITNTENKFFEGCSLPESEGGLGATVQAEIEFCEANALKGVVLDNFVKADCSGRLALTGQDLTFCENTFDDNVFLIGLRDMLQPFADRFKLSNFI